MSYVELHAHSAFSFLDGASSPDELALRAAELGYRELALTDHDGIWGSMEFACACHAQGIRPITGAEVTVVEAAGSAVVVPGFHRSSTSGGPIRAGEQVRILYAPGVENLDIVKLEVADCR